MLLAGSAPDVHATESTTGAQVAAAQPQPGPVAVPEPSEKALAYPRGGNILWLVGNIWDRTLETSILQLAERAGIAGSRVFEVDKSTDTNAVNAYVSGFGNTQRIVLWDTIIAKLTAPQLLFVMGHEMGHYVLGHVWKLIAFFSVLIIATLFAIHRTADWMIQRYRHRFRFDRLSDIASFPLVVLLFNAYFLIVTPVALTFTRHIEHEADRFGLEITRDNYSAATAFVRLQSENLGVPRPALLVKLWRESHPTLGDRIDFCNAYRPWETGQPLVYGHLFRNSPWPATQRR